jgi:hypothetical protein
MFSVIQQCYSWFNVLKANPKLLSDNIQKISEHKKKSPIARTISEQYTNIDFMQSFLMSLFNDLRKSRE